MQVPMMMLRAVLVALIVPPVWLSAAPADRGHVPERAAAAVAPQLPVCTAWLPALP